MLRELTASTKRLALVGLAKNTGKTETLAALLRELASSPGGEADGTCVGVTSVGRDGEQRDVIDPRIEKPRVHLPAGSLLATTDALLRASGLPYKLLEETGMRTPLGRVVIARLRGSGAVEVAGPSAAADVRAVSDAMLAHGAERVLIDGAIDRRAASSPDVADGLIVSTGAVLDRDISEVVRRTRDAVELMRLPLVEERYDPLALPPRFALTAEADEVARLLDAHPTSRELILAGALPERFLDQLAHAAHRRRRALVLVVTDPTKVFISDRGLGCYREQGIDVRAMRATELKAITVNPVAPRSHRLDSAELRMLLRAAITDVPVFDVLDPGYAAASA